jgi:hypothetical protein
LTNTDYLSQENILAIARKYAPHVVDVSVSEKEGFTAIHLKWKDFHIIDDVSQVIVENNQLSNSDSSGVTCEDELSDKIKSIITQFGKDECDSLMTAFGLNEFYNHQFEDKNVLYKVKYNHERIIGQVKRTRNIGFHYYDQVKISIPFFSYFWNNLLLKNITHKNANGLFDLSLSVCKKFEQVFFNYDMISDIIKNSKNIENPATFFGFYNHFTQFVSTVKTIGDNLAWILKIYLDLDIHYKQLDLSKSKFQAKITNPFNELFALGYMKHLDKLGNLRDIIQHRTMIRTMRAIIIETGEKKIVVPKDPETLFDESVRVNSTSETDNLTELLDDPMGIILNGYYETVTLPTYNYLKQYDDVLVFCERHLNGIIEMTNFLFKKLIIDKMGKYLGQITNYDAENLLADVTVVDELKIDENIIFDGPHTSIIQTNKSMKFEGNDVKAFSTGKLQIETKELVRRGDRIYKILKAFEL